MALVRLRALRDRQHEPPKSIIEYVPQRLLQDAFQPRADLTMSVQTQAAV